MLHEQTVRNTCDNNITLSIVPHTFTEIHANNKINVTIPRGGPLAQLPFWIDERKYPWFIRRSFARFYLAHGE